MAETIDDTAKTAPQQQKKEEPKKIGTLESVVNETIHGAKSLFNLGLAAGIPYFIGGAIPSMKRDAVILSASQIAADATTSFKRGMKYTSGDAASSSLLGGLLTVPLHEAYRLVNTIPLDSTVNYATRGALWGGVMYPLYIGAYQFADYVIKNRTFKGVGKYIKENYWSTLKSSWKYILPLDLASVFFLPLAWQVPVSVALGYVWRLFAAPKKGDVPEAKKRDKTLYSVALANVGKRIQGEVTSGAYNLGSTIRNGIDYFAKPAAKPAAAPAMQPA